MEIVLPYLISGMAASAATGMETVFHGNKIAILLVAWLSENGVYYTGAALCGRLARAVLKQPKSVTVEAKEPLLELILVESVDTLTRLFLMWIFPIVLGDRRLGLMWGSYAGDVVFLALTQKKRALLELACRSGKELHRWCFKRRNSRRPRSSIQTLGLVPFAA